MLAGMDVMEKILFQGYVLTHEVSYFLLYIILQDLGDLPFLMLQ
jgi:NhaP-type Na+/H+ and K+/H+ antiporter